MSVAIEHTLPAPSAGPDVLALGAWFKNTVCALIGDTAVISPSVGDLDGVAACLAHEASARAYLGLFEQAGAPPVALAHDLHPDFYSSRLAAQIADELGVLAVPVQHHHAHIAAVAAEHGHDGPLLGLALDGVGLGLDGTAWGGELLWVQAHRWDRIGGLRPLRLPGGDRAAREPWRMAASVLHELGMGDQIADRWPRQTAASGINRMMSAGLRSPATSSMGRVFDAVAGLLSLSTVMTAEAQAAIALEQAAQRHLDREGPGQVVPDGWAVRDGHLDLRPLLATLVDVPPEPEQVEAAAARFHATLAAALADWVGQASAERDLDVVAFAGGCFLNRILREDLGQRVRRAGLHVLEPATLGAGDTAIAFGQAVIARSALAGGHDGMLALTPALAGLMEVI